MTGGLDYFAADPQIPRMRALLCMKGPMSDMTLSRIFSWLPGFDDNIVTENRKTIGEERR